MDDQDSRPDDGYLVEVKQQGVVEKHRYSDRDKALEEVRRMPEGENLAVARADMGRTLLVEKKKKAEKPRQKVSDTGPEPLTTEPRRGRAYRRVALFGGLIGLMLVAPMFLLLGTGVKITRDPAFVPAPQAKRVAVNVFHRPAAEPPPEKVAAVPAQPPPLLENGIAAMLKAPQDPAEPPASFPYTVHVGSFRTAVRAAAQVTALREQGLGAFSAYVTIPGMGGWFRVFCGNHPTREGAEKGRARLAEVGVSETSRTKKNVALAVGAPLSLTEALALESRLHAKGFFAYAMPHPLPDGRVQVLIGAFQSGGRAQAMQERLAEEGFQAKAVKR